MRSKGTHYPAEEADLVRNIRAPISLSKNHDHRVSILKLIGRLDSLMEIWARLLML